MVRNYFHLHLVSDATGETLIAVSRAAAAQYETVSAIERLLGDYASDGTPRLLHGVDATAWPLLREAARRGYDARIGLEDTLRLPGGEPPGDNLDLVKAARAWISGVARDSVSRA